MDQKRLTELSKFLSFVLRHEPEAIGVVLDANGWIEIDGLVGACRAHGKLLSRELLETIVATSPKQRFAISEDGQRVRASQGHSIEVDLAYHPAPPPETLFHGTIFASLPAIRTAGLKKMERHHVHLSPDAVTARIVGMRRGKPVVLQIAAGRMHRDGHDFYLSANEHRSAARIRREREVFALKFESLGCLGESAHLDLFRAASAWLCLSTFAACAHPSATTTHGETLFVAHDFTAPRFTSDIEGPEIDAHGNLLVTNFEQNGTIGLVSESGACERYVTLPSGSSASSIKFDSRGRMLVADYAGHNILAVDASTRAVVTYVHSTLFNQPNDMVIARQDVLYLSDPNFKAGTGQVFRVEHDQVTRVAENMGTTNGIELSPDERTLYVNESAQRRIWAFTVEGKGLVNQRLFAAFPDHGLDGMRCDRAGNLYVTRYGKGTVVVLSPDGKLIREIMLRSKAPSNLVFGGRDGRTVFVTAQDRKLVETFRVDVPGKRYR